MTWQIGKVKVRKLVESNGAVPHDLDPPFIPAATPEALRGIDWLYPHFVDEQDRMRIAMQALLVEAPDVRIMVDTCIGKGRETPAGLDGGADAPFMADFKAAGLRREDINFVLCTHMHFDHVGWNVYKDGESWRPTFPKARYLFGSAEYEHWRKETGHSAPDILASSINPIMDAGLCDLVASDHRICPEVRLLPTPGHTPGHVSVLIESEGQAAVITGDMTHHPCQIAQPGWFTSYDSDRQAGVETRRRMFETWTKQSVLVIGTHFASPTAGRIVRDGNAFRLEC